MSDKNKNEEKEICDQSNPKFAGSTRNVTHPLRYYEFSPEEMKALEECDKDSFYQRCLPFSSLLAAAAYAGVKHGTYIVHACRDARKLHRRYLAKSPHFGAFPKVILAAFIGHCYGRVCFIAECEKKLRRLPNNSHLGNVMRQYYIEKNPPKKK